MDDRTVLAALERDWDASDASDFKVEHQIYHGDAVIDYPQSGERIRGRHNIQESRFAQPNKKRAGLGRGYAFRPAAGPARHRAERPARDGSTSTRRFRSGSQT